MTGVPESLHPTSSAEALDIVRWAAGDQVPLELVGGGTKRGFGRPVQAAHSLDLSALAGITLYEPEELVLSAGPGTPIEEIEAALRERGQMLAFEPPDLGPLYGRPVGQGTLGGAIGCNLSGPRRIRAGAARDHVLGIHAVSGRGEAFKSGGRVVKNVTGYDLPKLLTGSFGTLAAMTAVTVKVLPAPEATRTLAIEGLDDRRAIAALTLALQSPCDVSGAAHMPAGPAGAAALTLLRVEGFRPSVVSRSATLEGLLSALGPIRLVEGEDSAALWRAIGSARVFAGDDRPVWRISVAPSDGPAVAAALGAASHYFDWGGGLIWAALDGPDPAAERVRAAVGAVGGHATLIRAPDPVRAAVAVFHPQPAPLSALSARVKGQFDPSGILNPGRMTLA